MEMKKLSPLQIEARDNYVDLTQKFMDMVSYDRRDFLRFQNYLRHFMLSPKYHKRCDANGVCTHSYWKATRFENMNFILKTDSMFKAYYENEEKTLLMFRNNEKFKKFLEYLIESTKKRARNYAKHDYGTLAFPVGSFSSSIIKFDEAFIIFDFNYIKGKSMYSVFSSRPYATSESNDTDLLEEAMAAFDN